MGDHLVPRAGGPRAAGLAQVAHDGERPAGHPPADHPQLHGRQVLGLVDDHVAERAVPQLDALFLAVVCCGGRGPPGGGARRGASGRRARPSPPPPSPAPSRRDRRRPGRLPGGAGRPGPGGPGPRRAGAGRPRSRPRRPPAADRGRWRSAPSASSSTPRPARRMRAGQPKRSCTSSSGVSTGHIRSRAVTTARSARSVRPMASRASWVSSSSSSTSWPIRWRTTDRSSWARRSLWVPRRRLTRSHDAAGVPHRQPHALAVPQQGDGLGQAPLAVADGLGHDPGHAGVALEPGRLGAVDAPDGRGHQVGGRGQVDGVLAQGGQDLLDVAQEDAAGADEQHPRPLQGEAERVEQVGGPVEGDRGLARPRAALDDHDPGQGRAHDLVLLPLDGGHDVGHPSRPRPLQGGQQGPLAHQDQVVAGGLGGEQFVVEAGERAGPGG